MHAFRRAALRLATSSSQSLVYTPRAARSISTRITLRQPQPLTASLFQRRFISDEARKEGEVAETEAGEQAAVETGEPVEVESATEAVSSTPGSAQKAVEELPDDRWPGGHGSQQSPDILYVGNLFFDVTGDKLAEVFSKYGTIVRKRVVQDVRGLSKGFGFIQFENHDQAQAAVENLNQTILEGRRLAVQFHRPRTYETPKREPAPPSSTLYIGNMSFELSDRDLNDLFRPLRNVTDVRVAIDRRTGQPRGFAHADFLDVESATKAKDILHNKEMYGRKLRVDFGASHRSTFGRSENSNTP